MKTSLYKSTVETPIATFLFVVDSTEYDALNDLRVSVADATNFKGFMCNISKPSKTNRSLLSNMTPVKHSFNTDGNGNKTYWAWCKRI